MSAMTVQFQRLSVAIYGDRWRQETPSKEGPGLDRGWSYDNPSNTGCLCQPLYIELVQKCQSRGQKLPLHTEASGGSLIS